MKVTNALLASILAALLLNAGLHWNTRAVTRGDIVALRDIADAEAKTAALRSIHARMPVVWIQGGSVTVDGSVSIEGTVTVDGEVEISR